MAWPHSFATSSRTGEGVGDLAQSLLAEAASRAHPESSVVAATAARCHESLSRAGIAVASARHIAATSGGEELIAAELRVALDALGMVLGTIYTDDILDRIFGKFCIGK
jgi:tRNA modification GTPase